MRTQRYTPRYTVADYQQWEGSWELIDGVPSAMSPSPVKEHQYLAAILIGEIRNEFKKLDGTCGNCLFVSELDWIVDDETVLKPDVAIICDEPNKYISKAPVLIVEISSPSTVLKDRNNKFEIYQEEGVRYYILVDPFTSEYQIFVLTDGKYLLQNNTDTFSIVGDCSIRLNIHDVLQELKG